MERYQALNMEDFFNIEGMGNNGIRCWLLYQTDEETGRSIKLMSSAGAHTTVRSVILESLCYILYEQGEYYKKESLADQVVSYRLDMEQVLLNEGFKISIPEETLERVKAAPLAMWRSIRVDDVSEIVADDFKGCCVFHPIKRKPYRMGFGEQGKWEEEKRREVQVCYRPNVKQLNEAFLEEISCRINLDNLNGEEFDYKQYFANMLEDEQMDLNREESLELYNSLEKYTEKFIEKYYLIGKELFVFRKNGEQQSEIKEVYVLKREQGAQTEIYYDGEKMTVKDYTAEHLYAWWIDGRLGKNRNKLTLMGLL